MKDSSLAELFNTIFNGKHQLISAIDQVLFNIVTQSDDYTMNLRQDYIKLFNLKNTMQSYGSAHDILQELIDNEIFLSKEDFLAYFEEIKDNIVLWYGGLNKENHTDVRDDYLLLHYIKDAFKHDLKHASPFSGKYDEILKKGQEAIKGAVKSSWDYYMKNSDHEAFERFKHILEIYEKNINDEDEYEVFCKKMNNENER